MKSTVTLTRERFIAAPASAVWHVIATPEMHERLDPDWRLVSTTGNGDPGSEYVLSTRAGRTEVQLHYVIVESMPETSWAATIDQAGKDAGTQRAELLPGTAGTLLRWTVTRPAGRWTRHLVRAWCKYFLNQWLAAVDHHSRATPSGVVAV